MQQGKGLLRYRFWGTDNVVYGPVDLATLVNWVQEGRIAADTWVHRQDNDKWLKAEELAELKRLLQTESVSATKAHAIQTPGAAPLSVPAGSLRRFKVFAGLSDRHLGRFVEFMEVQRVRQRAEIIKHGEPGDAMYLVLEGQVRVRLLIGGKERVLVTMGSGEFFGEIALFDHGPRSADAVANEDSVLLKISAAAFHKLINEAPDLAAPFLFWIGQTLIARIRADNKRYRETITVLRGAE
jgi:hypothetical protein